VGQRFDSDAPHPIGSRSSSFSHSDEAHNRKVPSAGFPLYALLDIVLPMIIPDHMAKKVVMTAMACVLLLGVLLVALGTITRNRWGINPKPVNCPACGSAIPRVRQPKSLKQALWGGSTCEKCGCEMDKWGHLNCPESALVVETSRLRSLTSQSTCLFNRFAPLFGEVTIGRLTEQNPQ
jgi:hypothetical protein